MCFVNFSTFVSCFLSFLCIRAVFIFMPSLVVNCLFFIRVCYLYFLFFYVSYGLPLFLLDVTCYFLCHCYWLSVIFCLSVFVTFLFFFVSYGLSFLSSYCILFYFVVFCVIFSHAFYIYIFAFYSMLSSFCYSFIWFFLYCMLQQSVVSFATFLSITIFLSYFNMPLSLTYNMYCFWMLPPCYIVYNVSNWVERLYR